MSFVDDTSLRNVSFSNFEAFEYLGDRDDIGLLRPHSIEASVFLHLPSTWLGRDSHVE